MTTESNPAGEDLDGRDGARREAAPESPPENDRAYIGRTGATEIFVATGPEPWLLRPLDAFVVSVSPFGSPGKLGSVLFHTLSVRDRDAMEERRKQLEAKPIHPQEPVVVRLAEPEASRPRDLVLVTATEESPKVVSSRGVSEAVTSVLALIARHRWRHLAIPLIGSGAAGLPAADAARAVLGAVLDSRLARGLETLTLVTLDPEAADLLREIVAAQPQGVQNDLARGEDLLNVESEVHALADMLLLRDVQPPLVIGVLGGWGSGKSFAMHLMKERMREIRSWSVRPEDAWPATAGAGAPFVGHVYLIHFDAWTYAKSNLWASLMQAIFFELNRQLTLEQRLVRELGISPLEGGEFWKVLSGLDDAPLAALLDNELGRRAVASVRAAAGGEVQPDALWEELKRLKQRETKELQATEGELAEARKQLAERQRKLGEEVEGLIERQARWAAWKPLLRELAGLSGRLYEGFQKQVKDFAGSGSSPQGDAPTLDTILGEARVWSKLRKARPQEQAGFLVFAAVAAVLPLVEGTLAAFKAPGWVLALAAVAMGLQRTLGTYNRWVKEQHDRYEQQVLEERSRLATLRGELTRKKIADQEAALQQDKTEGKTPAKDAAPALIPALEEKIRSLEARARGQRDRIGLTAGFVSLTEFVQARVSEDLYAKQLGLMHQVQRDLADLTNSLVVHDGDPHLDKKQAIFPRGTPRIVLFIDDLDRCPPESVVQVLEAAQLLVKTPMFIVVVAMDVRYVTRALERQYQGILVRKGDPSGLDYIEKIIQVPYRVRPIDARALRSYLSGQMKVALDAAGLAEGVPATGAGGSPGGGQPAAAARDQAAKSAPPPTVLDFTKEEFELLETACARLDLSPRVLKRLVNVYKTLKIIWFRSARHPEPATPAKAAVLLLLALAARYPAIMRDPLDAVARAAERGSKEGLGELLTKLPLRETDAMSQRDWQQVLECVGDPKLLAPALTVSDVGASALALVQAFSFLGDSGYEPGDAQAAPPRPEPPPARQHQA